MQKRQSFSETEIRPLLRRRIGYSQQEMAAQLNVSRQFYQLWENGKKTSKPLKVKFYDLYRRTYKPHTAAH